MICCLQCMDIVSSTNHRFFDEAGLRAKKMRERPEFSLLRSCLPPIPRSEHNPCLPNLSPADWTEAALLRLDDDDWKAFMMPLLPTDGGPVETGDSVVDAWERQLLSGASDDDIET